MLTGEFKHTLDTKGRIFVPAKFRADLGQSVIIAKSFGEFLVMYSEEEWDNFTHKLDQLSQTENIDDMVRYINKNAMPTEIDNQGRINICACHREFACLDKEVSFIGMRRYVEIWSGDKAEGIISTYDAEKFKAISRQMHLGLG